MLSMDKTFSLLSFPASKQSKLCAFNTSQRDLGVVESTQNIWYILTDDI